ncbi:MAG: flagellar hook-length control protein FliK [Rhizomicrobium sp.]
MSTLAANVVTNGRQAIAAGGAVAPPTATDDAFAALLDEIVQAAGGANVTAAPSDAPSAPDPSVQTAGDPSLPVAADPAPSDASTPVAQTGVATPAAAQTVPTEADDAVARDSDDAVSAKPRSDAAAEDPDATPDVSKSPSAKPLKTADAPHRGVRAQPGRMASHAAHRQSDATDPNLAQTPPQPASAATPNVVDPATVTTAPPSDPAPATDPETAAPPAAPQAAPLPTVPVQEAATDIAAAAMQPAGTIAKPAQPGDAAKPQIGNAKSQGRQSAASALADAGKALGRVFTDQKVASALPVHAPADAAKPATPPATDPSAPPNPDSKATQTSSNAPQLPDAPAAAPPAHAQTAPPQPAPPILAAAPAAPSQPAAANAAVSAQLQIGHPAQPDIATLAFNIASKSEGGSRHFDIRLDPAELGRVDVRLTVDDAGKAQAMLSVEKPQTLELLQKDQPQLERALKDAGLDLSQNGLAFSLKGQQQGSGHGGGSAASSRGRTLAARAIAAVDSAASTVSLGQVSSSDTRLDIRV